MANLKITIKTEIKHNSNWWFDKEFSSLKIDIYYTDYIIESQDRKTFFEWFKIYKDTSLANHTLLSEEISDKPRSHKFHLHLGEPHIEKIMHEGEVYKFYY